MRRTRFRAEFDARRGELTEACAPPLGAMIVSLVNSLLVSVLLPTTPRAAVLLPSTPRSATAPSSRAPPPRLAVIVGGASASSQPPRLEQELEQSIVACGEWLEQNGGRRYPDTP